MFDSTYLTLLIGPIAVPIPAPLPVIEALISVKVTHALGHSGFQLVFTMGKSSILQTALLPTGFFDPISTRVVTINNGALAVT